MEPFHCVWQRIAIDKSRFVKFRYRDAILLDEARDPAQIRPGAIVVAGDEDAAAVCQVVDLVPAADSTIVHLKLLPGLVEDYQALAERSLAS